MCIVRRRNKASQPRTASGGHRQTAAASVSFFPCLTTDRVVFLTGAVMHYICIITDFHSSVN